MKKTTKYLAYGACGVLGAALLGIGCQVSPAQAACAYGWELYGIDDENVIDTGDGIVWIVPDLKMLTTPDLMAR